MTLLCSRRSTGEEMSIAKRRQDIIGREKYWHYQVEANGHLYEVVAVQEMEANSQSWSAAANSSAALI